LKKPDTGSSDSRDEGKNNMPARLLPLNKKFVIFPAQANSSGSISIINALFYLIYSILFPVFKNLKRWYILTIKTYVG